MVARQHGEVGLHVAGTEPGGDPVELAAADVGPDFPRMAGVDRHGPILPETEARPYLGIHECLGHLAA